MDKGGAMRKWIWIPAVSLLLLSAVSAFCQSGPAENAITEEEYGIYRLALGEPGGRSSVDNETLAGIRADADWLIRPPRIQPAPDMVKDFNEKNFKAYNLSEAFVREMAQDSGGGREGRKKTTFSRIGFDREKRHALLLMGITLYYPEDVMNEGQYVFLEKKDGKWTIVNTAEAWRMRLGPIR